MQSGFGAWSSIGGLAKMLAQEWEGDVTVVMPTTLAQVDQNVSHYHHTRNRDLNEDAIFCFRLKEAAIF